MIDRADLDDAIAWRLKDLDPRIAESAAEAIFSEWVRGEFQPASENRIADDLVKLGIPPGRIVVTIFSALVAKGAAAAGDWHRFYPAAYAVLDAHRQSLRAAGGRHGDALDAFLREMLAQLHDWTPALLWAELSRQASLGGDGVLADYDALADIVSFEPRPGADLAGIGYSAFRRRVQRLKKTLLRQHPAGVAPVPDTVSKLPQRFAA